MTLFINEKVWQIFGPGCQLSFIQDKMKIPGFLVVSAERSIAPNFFASLWQADQDLAFESALNPSIVQTLAQLKI